MVAANSDEEKTKWLEDLSAAISQAKTRPDDAFHYLSLKSISKYITHLLSFLIVLCYIHDVISVYLQDSVFVFI